MSTDTPSQPAVSPLTLVMTAKSDADYEALEKLIGGLQGQPSGENPVRKALDRIGTVHYARFVFLPHRQLAVITVFDGSLDDYLAAFAREIGFVFDAILKHVEGAPPTPVADYFDDFRDFVIDRNRTPVGPLYSAYPGRGVGEILVALQAADAATPR